LAGIADGLVFVSLERTVEVLIGERIKKEVLRKSASVGPKPLIFETHRSCEASNVRVEIIVNRMSVEKLAYVVRVITCGL
jgi:hypothetical protein